MPPRSPPLPPAPAAVSADWMPRNLDQRIEVIFPVKDSRHQQTLWNILQAQWSDNVKARSLQPDGTYIRVKGEKKKIRSQILLYEMTARDNPTAK